MVFMKGSPDSPQCQFSSKLVALLNKYVGTIIPSFGYFDIFQDEEVRQGMRSFSNWPTFPQVFVKGQLVGGNSDLKHALEDGSFKALLDAPRP